MKLFTKLYFLLFGTVYLLACSHLEPSTTFNWQIKVPLQLGHLLATWGQEIDQNKNNEDSNFLVLTFEHFWVQGPDGKTYAISKANYPTASNSNAADKSTKFNAQILQCSSHVQLEAKAVAKEMQPPNTSILKVNKEALPAIAHLPVISVFSVGKGCPFLTLPTGASLHKSAS